jgi:hypothetical protein
VGLLVGGAIPGDLGRRWPSGSVARNSAIAAPSCAPASDRAGTLQDPFIMGEIG